MGRKSKVFFNGIILAIVFLCYSNIFATTYYVAPGGNDGNNGTSEFTPWRTIAKLEAQILLPGDSVLFQANSCWRTIYDITESGSKGNYIYFGRYGTGKNPIFVGSEKAMNWTPSGVANVWQSGTSLTNTSDDYYPGRLFFMTDDSVSWGDYKTYNDLSELIKEFDYTVNGTTHYVYSTVDPDLAYDSIEVTQREQCIALNFHSFLEFNGIDLKFGQRQGVYEGYPVPRGTTDLIFRNCTVGYIGSKGSGAAYGIATFYNNLLVENCFFSDCGRRALSVNTYTDYAGGRRIENIIVRNNVFKRGYHTTSLDLSTMNRTGDTVMNVYFYNNIIDDSEIKEIGSWGGSNQLFTQAGIGTSLMTNIYIVGNVFIGATSRSILFENTVTHYVWNNSITGFNSHKTTSPYGSFAFGGADTIDMRNNIFYDNLPNNSIQNNLVHGYNAGNVYFSNRDYNLYYTLFPGGDRNFTSIEVNEVNSYYNTNQWSNYLNNFPTYDQHSPAPQNPNFVDYSGFDFRLSITSSAIGNGNFPGYIIVTDPFGVKDTINKQDVSGRVYSTSSWDIGAYAFSAPDSTETDIVSFTLPQQTAAATINKTNHTVSIQVSYGTNRSSLTPTIGVSQGASINPASGTARNFSSPVSYAVTSLDGLHQQVWTVTVTVAAGSSATDILTFSLPGQNNSIVNATNHTVTVNMPSGTVLTSLVPTITLSTGASINPASGIARNFASSVTYTVTAQDGTTQQVWTVTVNVSTQSNQAPVIDVLYSATLYKGLVYELDASNSYDVDGQTLSFNWSIPENISASATSGPVISILPTENTEERVYNIGLTVSDGLASVNNNINIGIYNYNPNAELLKIKSIEASGYESGNEPENIIDNDPTSRWSVDGDNQWITFELEEDASISHFELSFYNGGTRQSFFDIFASNDKETWDLILENSVSCGFSPNMHTFEMPETKASQAYKYIRLVGHMNSENTWNSYSEFKSYGYPQTPTKSEEISTEDIIEVYPNPTTDFVYVKTGNDSKIRIVDLSGAILYEQSNTIDISKIDYNFQPGMYLIQVLKGDKISFSQKLIVK